MAFMRALVHELAAACQRSPPLIQVIARPRQVGKTTAAEQLVKLLAWPHVWGAADLPLPPALSGSRLNGNSLGCSSPARDRKRCSCLMKSRKLRARAK